MSHDYAYKVRWDSEGSGTALVPTYADAVWIVGEAYAANRVRPIGEANRHGARIPTRRFANGFRINLRARINYGDPESAATQDSNRGYIVNRFTWEREQVWLQRNKPDGGDVEVPIVVTREPRDDPRQPIVLGVTMQSLEPWWRDIAVTHSAVNPVSGVTNAGNAPISDGSFVFSGMNGVQRLTNTTTGDWVEINTNTTVNAVTVDQSTGRVTQSGGDVDGVWSANDLWGIEVVPGANTFTLSGAGSVTFTGRDKWR